MKTINNRIFGVSLILALFIIVTHGYSQNPLNGTYTVGQGGTPGYETIVKATDSLETNGVDGPVTMNILSGNYYEQISLNAISGTSAVNTVTFQSEAQDVDSVMIYYTGAYSSEWVFGLFGCSYVTLQYLTIYNDASSYSRCIRFDGTSQYNTITNNQLIGASGTPTSDSEALLSFRDDDVTGLEISNNLFQNGSYSIYFDGYYTTSTDVKINNNVSNSYRGFYLYKQQSVEINGNTINSSDADAVYLRECGNDIKIVNNTINATDSYTHTGIYLYYSDGSIAFKGLIANNVITVDGTSSDDNYGIYCYESDYQQIYHNTVNVSETNSDGSAFSAYNGSNITLKNNMLVINYGTPVRSNNGSNITDIDYNNYYTNGNYIAFWGSYINELTGLQSANSMDANSTFIYPNFVSLTDYHPTTHWLDNTGVDLTATISQDFDSVSRSTTPDVGAYEFTATNTTTYSGTLTIQTSGGTFTSFSEAVDSLVKLGISGAVTINVEDGNYAEQILIAPIPGTSAINTITFTSASDTVSAVTLQHESTSSTDNYVVKFDNSDYIRFSKMTLQNTGINYGRVFSLNGNAHDNTIDNNILNGSGNAANNYDLCVIYCNDDQTDNLTITNNTFNSGSIGFRIDGLVDDLTTGLVFSNNTLSNYYYGAVITYCTDFEFSKNQITDFTSRGMSLFGLYSPFTINNNILYSTISSDEAIYFRECYGSGQGGLIFNNFITVEYSNASYDIYGIQAYRSSYLSFYHNSINVVSENSNSIAFYHNYYTSGETNIILKNNIFYVEGSGYPFYSDNSLGISESDYNNFYTSGSVFGRWNNVDYNDLASFVAASGTDSHSINFNPSFVSTTDLHTDSYWLDGAGTPITVVTTDFDGEARDGTNPDIGADEYTSSTIPLAGEYTIGSTGNYSNFTDAIADLVLKGITDTVIFNVLDETFNEQVIIPQIAGAADSAVVIFQADAGNSGNPIISYIASSSSDNYIIKLDGADYITIKGLNLITGSTAYSSLIVLSGSTKNIIIEGNRLSGRSSASRDNYDSPIVASGSIFNNILIRNNTIENGSFGIFLRAQDGNRALNIEISNNNITSYYHGIYLQYCNAPIIDGNYIEYFYAYYDYANGMELNNCNNATSNGMQITNNKIFSTIRTNGGIYLWNCDETGTYPGLIANNIINVGANGLDNSSGIYFYQSDYKNVYYNSVNVVGNDFDDKAFYTYASDNITAKNNIFAIHGERNLDEEGLGFAVYTKSTPTPGTLDFDYNNYYTPGRWFAAWEGSRSANIADFQAASNNDIHSTGYFPAFYSKTDLHTQSSWLDNTGTPFANVLVDIDSTTRNVTTPDIGAYEFTSTQTPLSGTYILGNSQDFPSFDSLTYALMDLGISAPVTINVNSGFYLSTSIVLKDIPGTNSSDTVVIQSTTGNNEDVTIGYPQDVNKNRIIHLNGTDYLTIKNMTFSSGGTTYSTIIYINGNSLKVNIIGNIFNGVTSTGWDGDNASIQISEYQIVDSLLVDGNTFYNNSLGIDYLGYYYSASDYYNLSSLQVINNEFNTQVVGVYFKKADAPKIRNNVFINNRQNSIRLYECDDAVEITGNIISDKTNLNEFNGIYLEYCDGSGIAQGLIANNFVSAVGYGWYKAYGIRLETSNYQRIYHNTVNITGANTGNNSFRCYNGGNNIALNNIFTTNGGYAFYISGTSPLITSGNNALYTNDSYIAGWYSTNYATLTDLQSATTYEDNSLNVLPVFISSDDLHLMNNDLMGKGSSMVYYDVPTDIDGEPRDASTPDIGADELICYTPTLNVSDLTICQYQTVEVIDSSYGMVDASTFYWDFDNNGVTDDTTFTFDTIINYAYNNSGNFTAKLTVFQPGGCEDFTTFNVLVYAKPDAPVTSDTVIGCYGQDIPDLIAEGSNILWYNNTDLDISHLVYTGDSLATGQTELSNYTYYATQTANECESDYSASTLSIKETPDPPVAGNKTICFGDSIPTLSAEGTLITWYADVNLDTVLWSANDYTPEIATAGIHDFYVTQNNGECESFPTLVTLEILAAPTINADISNIDCIGNDFGMINLTITNGEFPYYFAWSNGESSEDVTNLNAGDYFVLVTDANSCQSVDTFTISQPDSIHLELIINDSECAASNGSATVTASGGNPPFEYHWSNSVDEVVNDSLSSGIYIVTVTDESGCSAVGVAPINDLGAPEITVNAIQNVSCYGGSDGQISLTVTGTATPFTYEWSNGEITEDVSNLQAGPYQLQVTDTSGCLALENFVVTEPDPINIVMSTFEATCGQSNGSAVANVLGGVSPFNYNWSTGSANPETLAGLALGVYGLTVTDNNLCDASKLFSISELGAPSVVVDSVIEGSCGNSDGAVYISVYGSSDEYFYLWSNDSTSEDLIGVNAGEYNVVVSDTSGCSSAAVAVIKADKPPVNPICLVTVDTATNYNEIVWEKLQPAGIDHYNIYKESTQSDVYFVAGSVPVDSLSIFTDTLSNSLVRSWRYKLSAVDECGVESELSEPHKTMHLNVNLGTGGDINLIWEPYEGIDFSTYFIYRDSASTGWVLFDSIPANITSWSDVSSPGLQYRYFIELRHPYGCSITKATNRNASRSNTASSTSSGTQSSENSFISYTFDEAIATGIINSDNHTVSIIVESGTDISNLIAIFESSANSTVKINDVVQVSGATANNFTNPVIYTIVAEDGSVQDWAVTVTIEGQLSSENDFISYLFAQSTEISVINTNNNTIVSTVAGGTDLTNLVAVFSLSDGATAYINDVEQVSGTTENDFSNLVIYNVIAEDGTAQMWVVDVNITGVEQLANYDNIKLYPNPNSGLFTLKIDLPESNKCYYYIYSY
ncbi:MAG: hypothetical protein GXO79_08910, partial [Chlorobi bacterium]|nr:hypothetical protein [Chlorobiota bacterium]